MIASWRGLVVAVAIAVVLALVVAIDVTRPRGAVDRALVPGFDPDRVTELVWERPGQPAIRVVRDRDTWRLRDRPADRPPSSSGAAAPDPAADASAIGDVLSALRGARWHRRGARSPVRATLTVIAGDSRRVLGLGEPLPGGNQRWIVTGDHGLVVDDWVARALDRDRLALRIKTPFAEITGARTIVLEVEAAQLALRIEGRPRRLAGPAGFVLAADLAGELERALAQIAIVRLPDGSAGGHGLTITAGADLGAADRSAVRLAIVGSCPGAPELVAVYGTGGDGCIERAVAAEVERAVGRLRQPPPAIVERRPIPFEVARVVLADGVTLDTSPPRLAGEPADPDRVEELLHALAAPAEVTAAPARPAARQLVVHGTGHTITLDLFADRVLARRGEPVALRLGPGAWNPLVRPSRELRDPTLWLEEPTTITALRVDGVRYQRGAVIGAWTRQLAVGTAVPVSGRALEALEALVAVLAAPRALGFLDDRLALSHRVTIEITPPAGSATERVLEIGAPRQAGCPVRVARDTFALPAIVCAHVAALAK